MAKKKGDKKTNNEKKNTSQKNKDRAIRTLLEIGVNSGARKGRQFLFN
jgi:hypothetical protein